MNGFTLLMTLASLGVDWSYGTTADKQREYTIQIEPEVLPLLTAAQPQHIDSDVPLEAGQIQRLCIRIGMSPVTHTAASEQVFRQLIVSAARTASLDRALTSGDTQTTILWPASGTPQQAYGVIHGYQPDKDNQQQYFVQIDPTTFRTLGPGDEIHATIDPAAGRVARFVVSVGNQQLPRIATKPTQPLAGAGQQTTPGAKDRSRFQFTDAGSGTTRGSEYAPVAGGDSRGTGTGRGNPATGYPRQPTQFGAGASGYGGSDQLANRGNQNLYPALEPPVIDPQAGYGPAVGGQAGGFNSAYAPSAYSNSPVATEPPSTFGYPPTAGGQQTNVPQPANRYDAQVADSRYAARPTGAMTAPLATVPLGTPPLATTTLTPTTTGVPATPDKPWTPFLLSMIALFFSIGGNLYLAWTALEFHTRYRNAIERLRSAARSS